MRMSLCSVCGIEVADSGNGRNAPAGRRKCLDCIRAASMRNCGFCRKLFRAKRSKARFCSSSCWYAYRSMNKRDPKALCRDRGATRRARKKLLFIEHIDSRVVFDRDDYICWICEEKTIPGDKRWAPSVDHIVPLSLGGFHCYNNVRTAHIQCNQIKGARLWSSEPLDPMLSPFE